ncbi:MAG: ABC transporter ATP-binding protein [Caldilineaceae bacterium]
MTTPPTNPLIQMTNITKIFPPRVVALDNVTVDFRDGEIHALVGENGAGKSTLMKVLYGQETATAGTITYEGRQVAFHDPGQAIGAGIGMVHQEILLVNEYTVWQNVVLGAEPTDRWGCIDVRRARALVAAKIEEFGFNVHPDALVDEISVAARQKVEILKLLYRNVDVLILDEPTAVLTPQEVPQLFAELRRLRDNGHTILFISHHLDEVLELSDRITVLRKGQYVATVPADSTSERELAAMMVGREVLFAPLRSAHKVGEPVLQIRDLSFVDPTSVERLQQVDLTVHRGEIVGMAGVEGNGQFELVNAMMGLLTPTAGSIMVAGQELTTMPILERRNLVSFVPQDRRRMGAAVTASITENMIMTHHRLNPRFTSWQGRLLNLPAAEAFTDEVEENYKRGDERQRSALCSLSGGNQQKILLGRELALDNPLLLLDQPTRGLDVGSIDYVHRVIVDASEAGRAILLISADLEELFRLSDRILVLYRGRIAADLPTETTNIDEVGRSMLEGVTK